MVSSVHTKWFQHCAQAQTWHQRISLKTMIVESLFHVRRKHLTRVTSSAETLEQSPDLPLLAKVLQWYHVDHLAFPWKNATKMSNTAMNIDTFARLACGLLPNSRSVARISQVELPQMSQILIRPCSLLWHTIDTVLLNCLGLYVFHVNRISDHRLPF